MKSILLGLILVLMAMSSGYAYEAAVWVDSVDGLHSDGVIHAGVPITFYIQASCGESGHQAISNGFRIHSSDGAQWDTTYCDTGDLGSEDFDFIFYILPFSDDGRGADTIGIAGISSSGGGMPPDFNGILATITIGPIAEEHHGRRICLNSSVYPVGGLWKWGGPMVIPTWGGPYCYTVLSVDGDNDGVSNDIDNCLFSYNPLQEDGDQDMVGDVCDNCPDNYNPDQLDSDFDGDGDSCDVCPHDQLNDSDGDGICGDIDNCPNMYNPDQSDEDSDGIGDTCEGCIIRGDINHNGVGPDIADLVYLVNFMFNEGPPLPVQEESDVNGNLTGPDIADLVYLINYMFNGGPAPVACP